ncbi:PA14 domain-containing protein [Streptomyces coeruleoprunus]|uniref:PA14 domain-containing protein n=1 Tax=Streptomyces coeruleoprunus TaxID=285563 RepID=A0ABV9XFN9_9ACTN
MAAAAVIATAGTLLSATPAAAAVSCTSPVWKVQFFANTSFGGTPKLTGCDAAISENYGYGDPAGVTLPKDNFSARWTVTRDFGSGGPFTFTAESQDGIRVYVDGALKIDMWRNVSSTQRRTLNLSVPGGKHTLRVDFVAWTGAANVKFLYAPRTAATVDTVRPLAPLGVTAAYDTTLHKATIRWSRNQEMDLAGYRVYRRLSTAGTTTWTRVSGSTLLTGTAYTDAPPATGAGYAYEVRAVDKAGNESAGSADSFVTSVDATPPGAPAGLALTAEHTGVTATWQPVADAASYRISRVDAATGAVTPVATTTGTRHTDTAVPFGKAFVYHVSAVDGAGNASAAATATATRPVAVPALLSSAITEDGRGMRLLWSVPKDADVASFRLHRAATSPVAATTGTLIACEPSLVRHEGDTAVHGCVDTTLGRYETASWAVAAVSGDGAASALSNEVTATYRDRTPPAAVTGLTATPTEYGVVLNWNANTDPDLKRYEVYIGYLWGDEEERVCSGSAAYYLDKATTTYTYQRTPDGDELCFFIDAVDEWNNSSFKWTGNAQAVPVALLDLTPTVETPPGAPLQLTSLKAAAQGPGVDLSWTAVDDASGYLVYRWNRDTAQYERLTAAPVTATTWTDATAATGTTHYYWVTAVLPDGSETSPAAGHVILPPAA